nr:hypothetical protein [Tanacetum cinerariifolium]
LDDAEGTACLRNAVIFEELVRMGAKTTNGTNSVALWHLQSSAWPIIKNLTLPSTFLIIWVLSLEQIMTNQAVEIEKLKKIVKKLKGKKKKRTHRLKRLFKVGLTIKVESSEEEEGLGDQEDASKLGRIAAIHADKDLSLIDETTQDQGRMNDEDLFGVNDLDGDEVIVDVTTSENVEQDAIVAEKEVSAAADEVVTTNESVKGITAATTPQISKNDVTLAQTLMEIKAAKPKAKGVTIQEPRIMMEPEKPLKKKDQIAFDEEVARKLDAQIKAEMKEEERIAREKNEAN